MRIKTDIVIVGSGAGGAALAKELATKGKRVLILERGPELNIRKLGTLRTAVLDCYDKFALRASKEGTITYRALVTGGTTVVSCGSAMRVLEDDLSGRGIDLTQEYPQIEEELNIKPLPDKLISKRSRLIMDAANRLGYEMRPMPKFIDEKRCISCGQCVLGCKTGAKWMAIEYVEAARKAGAGLINGINVKSVVVKDGKAIGLVANTHRGKVRIYAEKIILSAGGLGTPVILRKSGIKKAGNRLFGDFFNVTYGISRDKHIDLGKDPAMAVGSTKFMKSKGFIMSSFVDVPFVLRWVMPKIKQFKGFKYKDLLGIMVKIQDENLGKVNGDGRFEKTPTAEDIRKLDEGAGMAKEILMEAGIREKDIIFTGPRAAHPGGSAAIGEVVDKNLETEIKNLFVCDASVLPKSSGAPPIVTIIALAKRLSAYMDMDERGSSW